MERVIEKKQKSMLAALEGNNSFDVLKKANPEYVKSLVEKAEADWSELEGSEKQIAWAEKIRAGRKADIVEAITANENRFAKTGAESLSKNFNEFVSYLKSQKAAAWWIDSRDFTTMGIIKERFDNK